MPPDSNHPVRIQIGFGQLAIKLLNTCLGEIREGELPVSI